MRVWTVVECRGSIERTRLEWIGDAVCGKRGSTVADLCGPWWGKANLGFTI